MTIELKLSRPQIERTPALLGLTSLFLAVLALSFAAIFIRLSEQELGPIATIFNRFWIATLILGLVSVFQSLGNRPSQDLNLQQKPHTVHDLLLLLGMSCFFVATLVTWAWSLTQTSVANSNLLHNVTPVFTTIIGWLLLRQRFENSFLIAIVLAISGSILIGIDDVQVGFENLTGDSIAVISAIFSAANLMMVEKLRAKFSATTILLWCSFFGTLLTFPLVYFTETTLFPHSWSGWLAVICLALVCQVLGQSLQAYNLKRFSSGFVAIFLLLDPVITALLAWFIFSESLNPLNWLAFSLVLGGIYLAKFSKGSDKLALVEG